MGWLTRLIKVSLKIKESLCNLLNDQLFFTKSINKISIEIKKITTKNSDYTFGVVHIFKSNLLSSGKVIRKVAKNRHRIALNWATF